MLTAVISLNSPSLPEDNLALPLRAAQKPYFMVSHTKFAELVPKEIRHSKLFVGAVLDSKGNVLFFTDSLNAMFTDRVRGNQLHYSDIIFSEDLERLRDALTLCLIGKTVSSLNLRMQSAAGAPVHHVLWEFTPASESSGDEALVLCIGAPMQSIAPQFTEENSSADSEVINNMLRRNRDLEQFANIVAHNIRSPLANIMGLNRLLGLPLNEADKHTALKGINSSAEKLENVIRDLNDVLQIRKADTGPKDLINFSTVVEDIRQSISGMIASSNATFICDFTSVPEIHSVRPYIQSIFLNLITNSIKYARAGVPPQIRIDAQPGRNAVTLRFSDNGIGIDLEKHRPHIFGLYKRFTDNSEGKGLGLYMVKTQVESLDGTVEIESKPGVGTEFVITLPQ